MDILLDILLKPPQPLMGLFLSYNEPYARNECFLYMMFLGGLSLYLNHLIA